MTTREDFFRDYISKRKPVVIKPPAGEKGFEHLGWNVKSWLDLESLSRKVGRMEVSVEELPRDGISETSLTGSDTVPFPRFVKSSQKCPPALRISCVLYQ